MIGSYKIYFQLAVIFMVGAIVLYFGKMHQFTWGNHPVLNNGATFNDLWYYNLDSFSVSCVLISLSYGATLLLNHYHYSFWCWLLKYIVIEVSLMAVVRSILHILTYNKISKFEIITAIILTFIVIWRSIKWYKSKIRRCEHTGRNSMGYN